ncbi:MAG TPA: V4R domain-containing protein [Gemmatimonadales bacterium]
MSFDGTLVGFGTRGLHSLRHILEREYGEAATASLQEAGFAAGDQVYDVFAAWLRETRGLADPADIAADQLGSVLAGFFQVQGWGSVSITPLGASGLAIDSSDWAEAEPSANALAPACHITAGMLAGFLGRLADQDVAVMEIECRTRNDSRCRFLAGAPETLQMVYDAVNAGQDYMTLLAGQGVTP